MTAIPGAPKISKIHPVTSPGKSVSQSSGGNTGEVDFFDEIKSNLGEFSGSLWQTEDYSIHLGSFNKSLSRVKQKYNNLYKHSYGGDYQLFNAYEGQNMADDLSGLISVRTGLEYMQSVGKITRKWIDNSQANDSEKFDDPAYLTDGTPVKMLVPQYGPDGNIYNSVMQMSREEYRQQMERTATWDNPNPADVKTPENVLDPAFKEMKEVRKGDMYKFDMAGEHIIDGEVVEMLARNTYKEVHNDINSQVDLKILYNSTIESVENTLRYLTPKSRTTLIASKEKEAKSRALITYENEQKGNVDLSHTKWVDIANVAELNMFKIVDEKLRLEESGKINDDWLMKADFSLAEHYKNYWINDRTAKTVRGAFIEEKPTEAEGDASVISAHNDFSKWGLLGQKTDYIKDEIRITTETAYTNLATDKEKRDIVNEQIMNSYGAEINEFIKPGTNVVNYNNVDYKVVGYDEIEDNYALDMLRKGAGKYLPESLEAKNTNVFLEDNYGNKISVPIYKLAEQMSSISNNKIGMLAIAQGEAAYDVASSSVMWTKNNVDHLAQAVSFIPVSYDTYSKTHFENHVFSKGDKSFLPLVEQYYTGNPVQELPFDMRTIYVDRMYYYEDGLGNADIYARTINVVRAEDAKKTYIADKEKGESNSYDDVLEFYKFSININERTKRPELEYNDESLLGTKYFALMEEYKNINFQVGTLAEGDYYLYIGMTNADLFQQKEITSDDLRTRKELQVNKPTPIVVFSTDPGDYVTDEIIRFETEN